ncbi:MAG: hypothetical protein C4522_20850 [Desulfobacteraceae bacterium]|nr:MAG: hypothetical protein C4522_20850 [Desulfobacteraceae bacterium]
MTRLILTVKKTGAADWPGWEVTRKNMKLITMVYILNATLLLLHEIESAYEKEWEILKLPGKISGFLLLHIPIILFIFYGLIELEQLSAFGLIAGIILGIGGLIPFVVHKIFVKRSGHFDRFISNSLIYLNVLSGGFLLYLSWGTLLTNFTK